MGTNAAGGLVSWHQTYVDAKFHQLYSEKLSCYTEYLDRFPKAVLIMEVLRCTSSYSTDPQHIDSQKVYTRVRFNYDLSSTCAEQGSIGRLKSVNEYSINPSMTMDTLLVLLLPNLYT